MIIDCFAGGGGASVGIEIALGRPVDIAINHDPDAIRLHKTNHPDTLHLTEDIFKVDLKKHLKGEHVALMWASPDCTSHSKAKGGKPREKGLRILPWAVFKHAKDILPDVILMENVEEIQKWGPLDVNGYPIPEREGEDYKKFITAMQSLGYVFDSKELVAADYGAPTTRKRWYAVFRRDGKPIVWPEPTHNKNGTDGFKKWIPVHTVLDFSDLGKSIFGRKKPLAENTLNRIARGLKKFVFESQEPFVFHIDQDNQVTHLETGESASLNPYLVQVNHGGDCFRGQSLDEPLPTITQKHGFGMVSPVVVPFIDKAYGGNYTGNGSSVADPLHTITTVDHNRLVSAFISKFYKTGTGQSLFEPLHTITTSPGHFGQVSVLMAKKEDLIRAGISKEVAEKCTWVSQFIIEYYGCGTGQSLNEPLHTIVTKDRFALITVLGNEYVLLDICLRMLTAEELKLAQGFMKDYIIDHDYNGDFYPSSKRVARIGNSVVPIMAMLLAEANCPYLKIGERQPILQMKYAFEDTTGQLRFA